MSFSEGRMDFFKYNNFPAKIIILVMDLLENVFFCVFLTFMHLKIYAKYRFLEFLKNPYRDSSERRLDFKKNCVFITKNCVFSHF